MQVVILVGGLGSRLSEETESRPKPMVEIGGKPILWHIMKIYSTYGFNDFILCLGYKGYMVKEYFSNYFLHMSNVTFDMKENRMEIHERYVEPWRITLVDTGEHTMTGGRIKRIADYLQGDTFCMTYGDGVGNVDIQAVVDLHKKAGRLVTVTAVQPPARFGSIKSEGQKVVKFAEKPQREGAWINGGFFVLSPKIIDYIAGDHMPWENDPMNRLTEEEQVSIYHHTGFWQPMDTLREKQLLEELWRSGRAPWRIW